MTNTPTPPLLADLEGLETLLAQARYVLRHLHFERPGCGYEKMAAGCDRAAEALSRLRAELDEARGKVARYEGRGGWRELMQREAYQVLGDPTKSVGGSADA